MLFSLFVSEFNAKGANVNNAPQKNAEGRMNLGKSEKGKSRDDGQWRGVKNNSSNNNNVDITPSYKDNNDNNNNNNNNNENTDVTLQMNDSEQIPDLRVVDADINVVKVEIDDSELFPDLVVFEADENKDDKDDDRNDDDRNGDEASSSSEDELP